MVLAIFSLPSFHSLLFILHATFELYIQIEGNEKRDSQ